MERGINDNIIIISNNWDSLKVASIWSTVDVVSYNEAGAVHIVLIRSI